jgi:UrcA family protein
MITHITRKACTLAAVAAASATVCLMSANVARADSDRPNSDNDVRSVKVHFAGLDLTTRKGSKLLYIRLQDAAEDVCGDAFETVNLAERHDIRQCEQKAIESAVARVDRPLLTVLYDRHFPREPLEGASRVSFAPGEVAPPVRVEFIDVIAGRG